MLLWLVRLWLHLQYFLFTPCSIHISIHLIHSLDTIALLHAPRLRVHRGPLFTRPPPFFHIIFRCAMACSWQRRDLCMSLGPTAQAARSWKTFLFFLYKTAQRFRRVFRGLAAITTTNTFHMHVFSAAGAEKEVLGGHERSFQIPLSSRSVSPTVFLSLHSFSPLLLYFLPLLPSLFLSISPSISYISSPFSVRSHAVLCEASNQHQQQDRAAAASSCSKATQQCEIDGCVARCVLPHCTLCASEAVCLWFVGWRDGCRGRQWEREGEENRGRWDQLCFCWVYIINALLNRTVSTHSISSDHKCKYCHEDKGGKLSKMLCNGLNKTSVYINFSGGCR